MINSTQCNMTQEEKQLLIKDLCARVPYVTFVYVNYWRVTEELEICEGCEDDEEAREYFREGYEQSEKDIISLIESRIGEILGDAQPAPVLRAELRGLIDKIKEPLK